MTEPAPRADLVAVDHQYLEAIRNGRAPTDPDRLAEFLLAWRAEVEEHLRDLYLRPAVIDYEGLRDYAVYSRAELGQRPVENPKDLPPVTDRHPLRSEES